MWTEHFLICYLVIFFWQSWASKYIGMSLCVSETWVKKYPQPLVISEFQNYFLQKEQERTYILSSQQDKTKAAHGFFEYLF